MFNPPGCGWDFLPVFTSAGGGGSCDFHSRYPCASRRVLSTDSSSQASGDRPHPRSPVPLHSSHRRTGTRSLQAPVPALSPAFLRLHFPRRGRKLTNPAP